MSKPCRACETRSVGALPKFGDAKDAKALGLCTPCYREASDENAHSDQGHESLATEAGPGAIDALGYRLDECWSCHPELNPNSNVNLETPVRAGSSRKGVRHTVRGRASGTEKAASVADCLTAAGHTIPKPRTAKGLVILSLAKVFELRWDLAGRYASGRLTTDKGTRAVRNVSELYRLLGVEAAAPVKLPEPVEIHVAPDTRRAQAAAKAKRPTKAEAEESGGYIVEVQTEPEPAKAASPAPKPGRTRRARPCGCQCNAGRMKAVPFGRVLAECNEGERCGHAGCGAK